jgi:hypothetical protein
MSITATVENDSIRLPAGIHLPDGTEVRVEVRQLPGAKLPEKTFGERYARFIGVVKDGPADLADNHDHYLHGAPKNAP